MLAELLLKEDKVDVDEELRDDRLDALLELAVDVLLELSVDVLLLDGLLSELMLEEENVLVEDELSDDKVDIDDELKDDWLEMDDELTEDTLELERLLAELLDSSPVASRMATKIRSRHVRVVVLLPCQNNWRSSVAPATVTLPPAIPTKSALSIDPSCSVMRSLSVTLVPPSRML